MCLSYLKIPSVNIALKFHLSGSLLTLRNCLHNLFLRGAADKSLARSTSRCRRTESIVSFEIGVCSCAELQVFSCYRG
jgi:hypothetical protein